MPAIDHDHVTYGQRDSTCVVAFQRALIGKGHRIPSGATGFYGDETKAACAAFQRAQGWSGSGADGLPGPKTFDRLGLSNGGHRSGGSGRVSSPVPGYKVTFAFGEPGDYQTGYHTGDDYAAPTGTSVVAVRDGTIAWSNGSGGAYGSWIGLRADNGRDYVYCHLSDRDVSEGDSVRAGQRLGRVGSTGHTTGPHLHFEDRPRGGGYGKVRRPSW